jgi:hypothetical protein
MRAGRLLLPLALVLTARLTQADPDEPRPAPPPTMQPVAPARTQVAAGDQLMAQGRYLDAAAQYEAAYTLDPSVEILERLADAYQFAGDLPRAELLRRRVAELRQPPPVEPLAPTPLSTAPSPRPVPARVRIGSALLRNGLGMFAGGYTSALIGGAIGLSSSSGPSDPYHSASTMMFIPVAGPFISLHWVQDAAWAVPAALEGVLQLAGVSLAIAGGALLGLRRKPPPVMPMPLSSGTTNGLLLVGPF